MFSPENTGKEKKEGKKKGRKKKNRKEKKEAATYFTTEFHSNMITGGVSTRAEGK